MEYVFSCEGHVPAVASVAVKNSINFAFIAELFLIDHVLIFHVVVVPDAHTCDGDCGDLIDRKKTVLDFVVLKGAHLFST